MTTGTAKRKELWVNGVKLQARSINLGYGGPEGTEENSDTNFEGLSYEFMASSVTAEVIVNSTTDLSLWDTSQSYNVVVRFVDTGQSYGNPEMAQKLVFNINDSVANIEFCGGVMAPVS